MANRIMVLGCSGMLGSAVFSKLKKNEEDVLGICRGSAKRFPKRMTEQNNIVDNVDLLETGSLETLVKALKPDVLINCVGVIKQRSLSQDPLVTIPVNSLFPHALESLALKYEYRLIHFSTDCVFSGTGGGYTEDSPTDASDLYGVSKMLGEIKDSERAVTIRTSIVGRELETNLGLVEWFLSQTQDVDGYTQARFSGLTTLEIANVLIDEIIPRESLSGLFHLAGPPVSKFELLTLLRNKFEHPVGIRPVKSPIIDRTLVAKRFEETTGYSPPSWEEMIEEMVNFEH